MIPKNIAQWWEIFQFWAKHYGLDPYILAAVCDRESLGGDALTPKGPGGTGDYGHGHGLMQIDDRTWSLWIKADLWRDPAHNIGFGAKILRDNLYAFRKIEDEALALRAGIAAYNCGPGNVRRAMGVGEDVDHYTAHGNYSVDVVKRAGVFRKEDE